MTLAKFLIYGFGFVSAVCLISIVALVGYLICAHVAAKIRAHLEDRD